jgi:hypothetical protein
LFCFCWILLNGTSVSIKTSMCLLLIG